MHDGSYSGSGESSTSSRNFSFKSTNALDLIYHSLAMLGTGQTAALTSYSYPPHNIIVIDDNKMEIEVSVAGFTKEEITVTEENSVLGIAGKHKDAKDGKQYMYKGLATRSFNLRWKLPRHVVISDGASIENGILRIKLERIVPEAEKPRVIPIK